MSFGFSLEFRLCKRIPEGAVRPGFSSGFSAHAAAFVMSETALCG
jgi:hypothetical protein